MSHSRSHVSDRHRSDSSSSRSYRDSYRRSSAGPSRGRSPSPRTNPRDDDELPAEFGRAMEPTSKEDEKNVLKKMKTGFTRNPLRKLNECIELNKKIKIYTQNFEGFRGICIGYVLAFDRHWNVVLSDVDEVFKKPKKAKTPYLVDVETDDLPELQPKVKKPKRPKPSEEKVDEKPIVSEEPKTPKKKKREKREYSQRHLKQVFIRGDSIALISVL